MEHCKIVTDYEKRNNCDLFQDFHKINGVDCVDIQNYTPVFDKFFSLNGSNYNSINLKHKYNIDRILGSVDDSLNLYKCKLNSKTTAVVSTKTNKNVFFKFAPLLDPFKYLTGKYTDIEDKLYNLPSYDTEYNVKNVPNKLLDVNNCAYIDGFFSFLSSHLIHEHGFIHAVDFYGSFLANKKNFVLNVADDIEYLYKADYFIKNKGVTFEVEDYSFLFNDIMSVNEKLPPIKIDHNISNSSRLSIKSVDLTLYDELFETSESNIIHLNELNSDDLELIPNPILDINVDVSNKKMNTYSTTSSCSSRSSHTDDENGSVSSNTSINHASGATPEDKDDEDWEDCSTISDEEIDIGATINVFPTNIICLENCERTLDDLIMDDSLVEDEWASIFMQIVMTLLVYQKCFSFTHNDLHTNNVMYNTTDKKYIYYKFNKLYYKVPTFGRVMKIIDFGRSIYKYDKHIFCSDSFQPGSDAATQYNTEPYFVDEKPRLDPNFSFDLCRLGCSIFDYLVEDLDKVDELAKKSPIVNLINEWCTDDKGQNILYKSNGDERYPDFKLYKMIARGVHKHTPSSQLDRELFSQYVVNRSGIPKKGSIINIDKIAVFYESK